MRQPFFFTIFLLEINAWLCYYSVMGMENDENFNFLFNEEFENIPALFRFSQKRYKIALIIMLVLLAATCILTTIFYYTAKTEIVPSLLQQSSVGTSQLINTYEYGFLYAALAGALLVALIGGWMLISRAYEKRAFKRASYLSSMIAQSERLNQSRIWSDWKMQNRDY